MDSLGRQCAATLIDMTDLAMSRSKLATSHLPEVKGKKNKAVRHTLELRSEQTKLESKVSHLYKKVINIWVHKRSVSAEAIAVGVHHDKLNDGLTS